jgi:small nuclear ribonucleoprotein (snRNP)-like protein
MDEYMNLISSMNKLYSIENESTKKLYKYIVINVEHEKSFRTRNYG